MLDFKLVLFSQIAGYNKQPKKISTKKNFTPLGIRTGDLSVQAKKAFISDRQTDRQTKLGVSYIVTQVVMFSLGTDRDHTWQQCC
jgi:hypothetical protein